MNCPYCGHELTLYTGMLSVMCQYCDRAVSVRELVIARMSAMPKWTAKYVQKYLKEPLYMAVLRDPADKTVRLAFADWLDERDDHPLAERIRKACNGEEYEIPWDEHDEKCPWNRPEYWGGLPARFVMHTSSLWTDRALRPAALELVRTYPVLGITPLGKAPLHVNGRHKWYFGGSAADSIPLFLQAFVKSEHASADEAKDALAAGTAAAARVHAGVHGLRVKDKT